MINPEKEYPLIVCICGSSKFDIAFKQAIASETLAGNIVLVAAWFDPPELTANQKAEQEELNLKKVSLSDEIFVVNKAGTISQSTQREIQHAKKMGKKIRFLEAGYWKSRKPKSSTK